MILDSSLEARYCGLYRVFCIAPRYSPVPRFAQHIHRNRMVVFAPALVCGLQPQTAARASPDTKSRAGDFSDGRMPEMPCQALIWP